MIFIALFMLVFTVSLTVTYYGLLKPQVKDKNFLFSLVIQAAFAGYWLSWLLFEGIPR